MATVTIAVAFWQKQAGRSNAHPTKNHPPQAPAKMIAMGPVGTNITSVEQIGDVSIKMTATRFWFKKSKIMGFDSGLLKKLAAKDYCLTISKAGKVILSAAKERVEMPMDRGVITIHHPDILLPKNMEKPDSIRFDKSKMEIVLRKDGSEKIWDLSIPLGEIEMTLSF